MCRPADPSDVTGRRPPGARRSMRQTRRWLQSRRETLFPFSSSISSSSSSSSVVAVVSFFLFCFPLHFFLFDSFLLVFVAGHVKSAGPVGGELLVHGGKQQFEHDDWHRVRPERDIGAVDNSIGNKMKQNKKKTHKKIIK